MIVFLWLQLAAYGGKLIFTISEYATEHLPRKLKSQVFLEVGIII